MSVDDIDVEDDKLKKNPNRFSKMPGELMENLNHQY
jgi:hypothetical protein